MHFPRHFLLFSGVCLVIIVCYSSRIRKDSWWVPFAAASSRRRGQGQRRCAPARGAPAYIAVLFAQRSDCQGSFLSVRKSRISFASSSRKRQSLYNAGKPITASFNHYSVCFFCALVIVFALCCAIVMVAILSAVHHDDWSVSRVPPIRRGAQAPGAYAGTRNRGQRRIGRSYRGKNEALT